ncbi:hypothetical protein F8S13_25870 [Chloroflexia bacterium SDU3-3]|nr:hypothetical protein F8S13_25870 [Chloroflexia bacterium SDU3-3]
MRKDEMTAEQLRQVALAGEVLGAAGWVGRETNELFERGYWMPDEAVYDYANPQAELVFLYSAQARWADIIVAGAYDRLNFVVGTADLAPLLAVLVAHQRTLSLLHYEACMREVMRLYPTTTYLYQENELFRLTE